MDKPYFAYGSNLDEETWLRFCADDRLAASGLKVRGRARLPDNVLVFNHRSASWAGGVLSIAKRRGGVTSGCLFDCDAHGRRMLDIKEGAPFVYRAEDVVVLGEHGEEIEAFTYRLRDERSLGSVEPSPVYLDVCRRGRHRHGLDMRDLDAAATGVVPDAEQALFVYGTLMRGELRERAWREAGEVVCALLAETLGGLVDCGAFPGLVLTGSGRVRGEFLRFADIGEVLSITDAIEGFVGFGARDNLYRRTLVEVQVGAGRTRRAWTYVLAGDGDGPRIESGCWRTHTGVRRRAIARIVADHTAGRESLVIAPSSGEDAVEIDARRVAQFLDEGVLTEFDLAKASGVWTAALAS